MSNTFLSTGSIRQILYRKSCEAFKIADFFSLPVWSKHDETFQNIWSNSTPTIFPFPNYYAASKFSMLATEYNYIILLMLDYIKKKNCKRVFLVALNILILTHLTNEMANMSKCFHMQTSLFHINKCITILFPCDWYLSLTQHLLIFVLFSTH